MYLKHSDIPYIKKFIADRQCQIAELELLPPTAENLAKVRKITAEAKDLQRSLRELKGNMYPYAS